MPTQYSRIALAVLILLVSALFLKMTAPSSDGNIKRAAANPSRKQLDESLKNMPLYFEPGDGAAPTDFFAHGNGYEMALSGNGALLSFAPGDKQTGAGGQTHSEPAMLAAKFAGSKPYPTAAPEEELQGKANYLIGNDQTKWRTDIPTYGKVRFKDVYSGIDLLYYGDQTNLEFDFEIEPGANPKTIKLDLNGSSKLARADNGDLLISLESGDVTLKRPYVYQTDANGEKQPVKCEFAILGPSSFGFNTGQYDRSRRLVIDPVLTYSTLLPGAQIGYDVAVDNDGNAVVTGYASGGVPTTTGLTTGGVFVTKFNPQGSNLIFSSRVGGSSSIDQGRAVKIDSSNNVVVVGTTSSSDFPSVNAVKGRSTVFISTDSGDTWTNSGNLVEYQTWQITPSQQDANLLYAAAASKIYRSTNGGTSWTNVTSNLPVASSYPFISVNPSNSMELMTAASLGVYRSTDGGGSWSQVSGAVLPGNGISAIEYDPSNPQTIYMANQTVVRKSTNGGQTWISQNSGFPANIVLSTLVIDPQNTSVLYAGSQSQGVYKSVDGGSTWMAINTGITGNNSNIVRKLAIDPSNSSNVYVATGNYASNNLVFKSVNGGANWSLIYTAAGVNNEIVAVAVSRTNSSRLYVGIVGSTGGFFRSDDGGATWNRQQSGMTYGRVSSVVESPFTPGKLYVGTAQDSNVNDAFVFKLNPSGNGFIYSSALGGSDYDYGYALAIDGAGNAYVGGTTKSFNFPIVNGFQTHQSSEGQQSLVEDGFVTKIAPNGNTIVYSTYLGGNSYETLNALAVNSQGEVAATGTTQSTNFPLVNPVQSTLRGSDVYVTKISPTGNSIQFSTLWGSTSADNGYAIKYDQSSNLIVVGDVSGSGLPLVNALDSTFGGYLDGFIAIFSPERGQAVLSSYWGGRDNDSIRDVDVDAAGNIYLAGFSSSIDFPQLRSIKSHSPYFRSSDSGVRWSNFNNDLLRSPGDLAFHPTDPNVILATTVDSVIKTTDGGNTWAPVSTVPVAQTYNSIEIDPKNPNTIYLAYKDPVGSNPVRLAKSIDGGATWTALSQFPSVSDPVYKIVVCASNPQIVYAGSFFSIYKSVDAGATWQRMVPFDIWPVQDFAVSPTDPSVLFFAEAYSNGGILRSTDGGVTWQRMANGITGQYGSYVVIDQQHPSTVYGHTQDGVFKSVDGGDSWTPLQIPQVSGKMIADPFAANSLYLPGALSFSNSVPGIFRSTDGGATWTFSNQGFYTLSGCSLIEPDTRIHGMLHASCGSFGGNDIFVSKLDPTGTHVVYSTLFGGNYNSNGSGDQFAFGLAVSPGGSAFVTGGSAMTDFPTTTNAFYRTVTFTSLFLSRLDPSWSVRGTVIDGQSNLPVVGVTVSTTGSSALNAKSDGLGKYSFPNIAENSGLTFTPRKLGYDFTPPSYTVDPLVQDQTLDFTAEYITYTIQGTVTLQQNPLPNVVVNLTGSQTASTTTDAQGNFSFTVPKHGDYTVRPVLAGYIFSPQLTSFTDVSANLRSDFAARAGYSISGQITRNGNPVVGASINLGGSETQSTQTDAQGRYSFDAGANGDYQVSPLMDGLGFLPSSRSFAALAADQTGDFTAFRLPSVIDHITFAANVSQFDSSTRIYNIDDEGYGQQRITSATANEGQPAWSPNGRRLAYVNGSAGTGQLLVVDAKGSNSHVIVGGGSIFAGSPDWSPDGKKIAFSGYDPSVGTNIYIINPDGTGMQRLTGSSSPSYNPAWSPDGTRIAFSRSGKIYTINTDGTNAHTIINSTYSEDDPDWSPDGTQLVFTGSIGSTPRIYIVNADGTGLHRLTSEEVFMESSPAWSLDGARIAYIRNNSYANVYTIKTDGTDLRQITNTQWSNYTPAWKPKSVPNSPADFDGDGKTDLSVFRPNTDAEWWYQRSSDSQVSAAQFGLSTDIPVTADFTGDGKADIAFFRPPTGQWFILRSEDSSYLAFPFGASGDIPIPADFDGDGTADAALFRPSTGTWFILPSAGGATIITQFGVNGDQPVAADYDGDGKADLAVYRLNNGAEEWWLQKSTAGAFATVFGTAGDKAVPGDYTGDGSTDIAVWRPSTGQWFILRSEDLTYLSFPFGAGGDVPAPGDYDGDGKFDPAVFRPSTGTWYVDRSGGAPLISGFGASGDLPIPSEFVR